LTLDVLHTALVAAFLAHAPPNRFLKTKRREEERRGRKEKKKKEGKREEKGRRGANKRLL
jgi:hypothetical protein